MATSRLTIAYDGSGFAGWAHQRDQRTVQGVIEEALSRLSGGRREPSLTVAGRTDRGVHAWAQVASHPGEPFPARALNAVLPDDVAVLASERAPEGFDARRDALARTYCYRILHRPEPCPFERGRALHWPHRLDDTLLDGAAAALTGTHDFTAFTPTETDHVRFERDVLDARWRRDGDLISFHITADAFLRTMIRVLVGTMLEVGGERRSLADFTTLLDGAPRSAAGVTAPPHGLYFAAVRYPQ